MVTVQEAVEGGDRWPQVRGYRVRYCSQVCAGAPAENRGQAKEGGRSQVGEQDVLTDRRKLAIHLTFRGKSVRVHCLYSLYCKVYIHNTYAVIKRQFMYLHTIFVYYVVEIVFIAHFPQ